MKTKNLMLSMLVLALVMLISNTGFSQKSTTKNKEIKIKTSAQCGMCKTRIENGLAYEAGIQNVSLDIETKVLTVAYNPKKTTEVTLRSLVNKLGYDADDTKANPEAYAKLPACCKKQDDLHKNCSH